MELEKRAGETWVAPSSIQARTENDTNNANK